MTIRFTPLSNTGVHRQIWAMNGFEIEENTAPSIENVAATMILGTTATIGGNVMYVRVKKKWSTRSFPPTNVRDYDDDIP